MDTRNHEATLSVRHVSRSFGPVAALRDVSLDLPRGQVIALVGDNGAGKSTLVKIISGADMPDRGELHVEGKRVVFHHPLEAREIGIESVYQDLAVAPDLDVVTNLFLGREIIRQGPLSFLWPVDRTRMREQARQVIADLNIHIPSIETPVRFLSGGQRQAVAVARGVMWARKVITLDEPTAALGIAETKTVLQLIKQVKAKGLAVLVVSHNLPEVFEVADRILVLRHGRRVANLEVANTSMNEVVAYMTGALGHDGGPERWG